MRHFNLAYGIATLLLLASPCLAETMDDVRERTQEWLKNDAEKQERMRDETTRQARERMERLNDAWDNDKRAERQVLEKKMAHFDALLPTCDSAKVLEMVKTVLDQSPRFVNTDIHVKRIIEPVEYKDMKSLSDEEKFYIQAMADNALSNGARICRAYVGTSDRQNLEVTYAVKHKNEEEFEVLVTKVQ
jgi:hypothetical protein